MRVDFFIIGAPKCGTTALASYLGEHPDICFSIPKEPGFFDSKQSGYAYAPQNIAEYHSQCFSHYNPLIHKLVGEGTTSYLYYSDAVPSILSYNPYAKFIVMLRNPVEMAIALHRELVKSLFEAESDFERAWNLQNERALRGCMAENKTHSFDFQYGHNCMLGEQMERLLSVVDRDRQDFICLLDDLREDSSVLYKEVCAFLGIDGMGRVDFNRINESQVWRGSLIRTAYKSAYKIKKYIFGAKPLPFSMDKRLRSILLKTPTASNIRPRFKDELKHVFFDDIKKLELLIDRDLSKWMN